MSQSNPSSYSSNEEEQLQSPSSTSTRPSINNLSTSPSTPSASASTSPSWYQRTQDERVALGNAKKYVIQEYQKYGHIQSDSNDTSFTKRQQEIQRAYTTLSACYKNAIPLIGVASISTFLLSRRFVRQHSPLQKLTFTSGILAPTLLTLGVITVSRHLAARYCDSKLLVGNERENTNYCENR
jgi:hypothetical protein